VSGSQTALDKLAVAADEATGAAIVRKALELPLYWIAANAGLEGAVAVSKGRELSDNEGLDASTGEYVDLFKAGVVDPAKVTRSAVQNAVSIASLLLTTETLVVDKPEEEDAAAAGGHGHPHGMGMEAASPVPRAGPGPEERRV